MNNQDQIKDPLDNPDPVDINDRAYKMIFEDLQGGIIKNYGRQYALYIFIQFDENQIDEKVKPWIRGEIASKVTSTWAQLEDTEDYKAMKKRGFSYSGKLCTNFFLSYQGYQILGFNPDQPNNKGGKLGDILFKSGMKENWENSYRLENQRTDYWYNPPENWDIGKDRVDALILLAHNDVEKLGIEAQEIMGKCEEFGTVLACEAGYVLRDSNHQAVGPFGFVDGISQPLFLKSDYQRYLESHCIDNWDPKASLNLVLVKDPFGEEYSYGSYCVWQKLETNYECFESKVKELADKLGCDRERASALTIGRFKDGTPLALSDRLNQNNNNFNYTDDSYGRKCPLQAHIRKVNPRKDDPNQEESRRRNRIFRAGITYFDEQETQQTKSLNITELRLNKLDYLNTKVSKLSLEDSIKNISGLLFVCFQSSIALQFSKLQNEWADSRNFPREEAPKYLDPIIGHPATKSLQALPQPQQWTKEWDKQEVESYPFYGCIKNRGGEFFFAPSISFLKKLPQKSKTTYKFRRKIMVGSFADPLLSWSRVLAFVWTNETILTNLRTDPRETIIQLALGTSGQYQNIVDETTAGAASIIQEQTDSDPGEPYRGYLPLPNNPFRQELIEQNLLTQEDIASLLRRGIDGILKFDNEADLWAEELLEAWRNPQTLINIRQNPLEYLRNIEALQRSVYGVFPLPDRPRGLEQLRIEELDEFLSDQDNMKNLGGIFLIAS